MSDSSNHGAASLAEGYPPAEAGSPTGDCPPLATAILRTLLYADVFGVPLTVDEIHRYTERVSASRRDIVDALENVPWLRSRVVVDPPYVALARNADAFHLRQQRERASRELMPKARTYARRLAALPYVRMVALTGSLAVSNLRDGDDDIDFLVVTAPGRLWLARLLVVSLVHLGRLRGISLCPNYLLASDALGQTDRSLFTARELAQMIPLYGCDVYRDLLDANAWARAVLPNGFSSDGALVYDGLSSLVNWLKRVGESVLAGGIGDALERIEMKRKIRRLATSASRSGTASARFGASVCKGHLGDYGAQVRQAYMERLQREGLYEAGERPERSTHSSQ